jgi:regulatory protein
VGFGQISLKGRALRLLAGREHSRAELERKLAPHEEVPGELQRSLDELQAKGFISDQRVLESVVFRRSPRLGALRVRQELQAKGLAPEAVDRAVADLQATELARAQAVWLKKFGRPAADAADRARQMRFLAARGFSAGVVQRVVKGDGAGDD